MAELGKVKRVIEKVASVAEVLLVIDGGFVINPSLGKYEIITYDATVGKKDWSYDNLKFNPEQIETYNKRYPP